MKKQKRNVLLPILVGACAGAVAAILFAPKSGKDTRSNISSGTRNLRRKLEEEIDSIADLSYVSNVVNMIKGRTGNGHSMEAGEFETHEMSGSRSSGNRMSGSSSRTSGTQGYKSNGGKSTPSSDSSAM